MSTELNSIKGKSEFIKQFDTKEVGYHSNQLHISSFYGGEIRGQCIQITIDDRHIQIEKKDVIKLIKELVDWIQ